MTNGSPRSTAAANKDVVEGEPQNQDHALGGIAIDFERTPYPSATADGTDLLQASGSLGAEPAKQVAE